MKGVLVLGAAVLVADQVTKHFALAHLPFSMWLPPLRQLPYNRRITCPACTEWAWVRAHWLQ